MADKAHDLTDKEIEKMERRLSAIYKKSMKEASKAWTKYLVESSAKIKALQAKYDMLKKQGKTEEAKSVAIELQYAKKEKTLMNKHYKRLTRNTAELISKINEMALDYINDDLPHIYTLNYNSFPDNVQGNLGGYSFTLTDANTIKYLAKGDPHLLPYKSVSRAKDVAWNIKMMNAEVLQGILQGESMDKIADRFERVGVRNRDAAIRNARTMVTSAECKGRQDSYVKAAADGVILQREWVSTNDSRTRDAHRLLDGQIAEVDKPFKSDLGDIMYPGDPAAKPANVYCCRCTTIGKVLGFRKVKK